MDNCERCKYFDAETSECRRHAPIINVTDLRWPIVGPKDWCGDFSSKQDFSDAK
jgi:hypothetical protein